MWITRAPGCVDLAGGVAEMPGSVSVSYATGRSVYSAIQNRDDDKINIRVLRSKDHGGNLEFSADIPTIYTKKGPPRSFAVLEGIFEAADAPWMMEMMAVMIGLRRTHQLNTPKQGFSLVVWSRMPQGGGFGGRVAFATSVALAFRASTGHKLKSVDGIRIARAVRFGYKFVLDKEISWTRALTSAVSQAGCLLSIEHGLDPIMQWVPLPDHTLIAALDTGAGICQPGMIENATVGAWMGLEHLNQALRNVELSPRGGWGQVTPAEFEGGLRDHVPTREKGKDWLEKFSESAKDSYYEGLADAVDPDGNYRDRAICEHHVRESGRAKRFLSFLEDYGRTKKEEALIDAGRTLTSSHRSYMEKCGLKNEVIDDMRKSFSSAGRKSGLFGARLSGGGQSGMMITIGHSTAMPALKKIADAHQKEYGQGGNIYHEVGQGGVLDGWWEGVLDAIEEDLDAVEGEAKAAQK
jgi:L-arabinokinase